MPATEPLCYGIKAPRGRYPTSNSKSYMWVQRGGPPDKNVILFDYEPSRAANAQRAQPKDRTGRADEALRYFARLYRIEREIKALTLKERTERGDLPIDNNPCENAIDGSLTISHQRPLRHYPEIPIKY